MLASGRGERFGVQRLCNLLVSFSTLPKRNGLDSEELESFVCLGATNGSRSFVALSCAGSASVFALFPMFRAMRSQQHTIPFLLSQCLTCSISYELRLVLGDGCKQVDQQWGCLGE